MYFPSQIISKAEKINEIDAAVKVDNDRKEWIKNNNINLNLEKDRIIYYDYLQKYSIKVLLKYPLTSIKFISWRTIQTGILNPIYIYEFYSKENAKKPFYYLDENYKKINIPLRIFYSLILYTIVIYRFFHLVKIISFNHYLLIFLSSFICLVGCYWDGLIIQDILYQYLYIYLFFDTDYLT